MLRCRDRLGADVVDGVLRTIQPDEFLNDGRCHKWGDSSRRHTAFLKPQVNQIWSIPRVCKRRKKTVTDRVVIEIQVDQISKYGRLAQSKSAFRTNLGSK